MGKITRLAKYISPKFITAIKTALTMKVRNKFFNNSVDTDISTSIDSMRKSVDASNESLINSVANSIDSMWHEFQKPQNHKK